VLFEEELASQEPLAISIKLHINKLAINLQLEEVTRLSDLLGAMKSPLTNHREEPTHQNTMHVSGSMERTPSRIELLQMKRVLFLLMKAI